jgi:hypothetical protein
MPRLKQVPRTDAPAQVQQIYDFVFGAGRDPVAEPGTETGTPGNWWTVIGADGVRTLDAMRRVDR